MMIKDKKEMKDSSYLVSVIIPVFNTELFIAETLSSIQNQTYQNLEIIVVNDGSTDNSLSIIQEFAKRDERFCVINQSNAGQSNARNNGLKRAKGDFIYFMDSDDIAHLNLIQTCIDYYKRNEADIILFDAICFQEANGKALPWDYNRTKNFEEGVIYKGLKMLHQMMNECSLRTVVWMMFIKRSAINSLSLNFYDGIIHEDELFTMLLMMQNNSIACIKQQLIKHRSHESSIMNRHYSYRNVSCYLTVVDNLFKFAQNKNEDITQTVEQYAHYTLSKVFYTAHVLTIKEKVQSFRLCVSLGLTRYIPFKVWLVFWLK